MASTAVAQMACAQRSLVISQLAKNFKEQQTALGVDSGGRVIELFLSNKGSFTILVSYPNNQSCILATGQGWQTINKDKATLFSY
jgi:hypothetical protein